MEKITQLLSGKKSYLTAGALVVLGVVVGLGGVEITPEHTKLIYSVLMGAGLAFLRSGSKADAAKAAADVVSNAAGHATAAAAAVTNAANPNG